MKRTILTIGLLALVAVAPASAGTLTFTDRGNWTSAVNSLANFDGGTQTVGTATAFNTSAGLSAGLALTDLQIVGFNIVTNGTSYDLQRANGNASQPWYNWGTGTILRTGDKTDNNTVFARITFSNPVSAFGFNFGSSGTAPGSVTISPGGLSSVTVNNLQEKTFAFFGVASDTQTFTFADIYINDTNKYLVLDDIAYGTYTTQSTPTPPTETAEPGTLLQLTMGGFLLAFARRRLRVYQAQST